jgi:hypothetical protein
LANRPPVHDAVFRFEFFRAREGEKFPAHFFTEAARDFDGDRIVRAILRNRFCFEKGL